MNTNKHNSLPILREEVYHAMILVAAKLMKSEPPGHRYQKSDLVHEAYLRIQSIDNKHWKNPNHLINVSSTIMKRILIDCARNHNAEKRGGLYVHLDITEISQELFDSPTNNELNDALEALNENNHLLYQIVSLRYYSGLRLSEIASQTGLSIATIKRKTTIARNWLLHELQNNINE